jgi:hypothetical protein
MRQPSRNLLFDRCAGAVLARLYESFPERITIDLAHVPESLFDDTDNKAEIWQKFNLFESTVRWLEQAGYLWTNGIAGSTANEVVLTPKALEVLKAAPFENKQPLGEFLAQSVKSGAKHKVEEGVGIVLDLGVKAVWWLGRNALT